MSKSITPVNESDWLLQRTKYIGSTESPALFGLSPYKTIAELFYEKQSGEVHSIPDNMRMMAGRALESGIAELAAHELGCEVAPMKDYVFDDALRMGSSFDFQIMSGEYARWILEIKNVDFLVYRDHWKEDEAPPHIEAQVQHQLELTGRPGAIIAALVGGNDLKMIVRERNPVVGNIIRNRIGQFWVDIEENNPPPIDFQRDADLVIALNQQSGDQALAVDESSSIHDAIWDYVRIKKEIKDLEVIANARKAKVIKAMGDTYNAVITPWFKVSSKTVEATPAKVITQDMVGQETGGRKAFRGFRVTEKK